ncbi:NAT5_1 [Sanghuangporus sanghuang]
MSFTEQESVPNGHISERISFPSITPGNVEVLRKLNTALFPIKYGEIFYHGVVQPEMARFCKLVYINDEPVGTITGRVVDHENETKLYIMTMGVLESHRSKKIGSKTLKHIVDIVRESQSPKFASILLHVWLRNEDAKRFYERNGFQEAGVAVEFYKADIDVRDAWILEMRFQPRPANGMNGVERQ